MGVLDDIKQYSFQKSEQLKKDLSAPKRSGIGSYEYDMLMKAVSESMRWDINRNPNKNKINVSYEYYERYDKDFGRFVISISLGSENYVNAPYQNLKELLERDGFSCYLWKKRIHIVAKNIKDNSLIRRK